MFLTVLTEPTGTVSLGSTAVAPGLSVPFVATSLDEPVPLTTGSVPVCAELAVILAKGIGS